VTPHWIRCSGLTLGVLVDATGVIVDAPSLVDGFIGQPLQSLLSWIEKFERLEGIHPDDDGDD